MNNSQPHQQPAPVTLLRIKQVCERVGISRASVYALEAKGQFVPRIKLSERVTVWPSDAIQEWIEQRIAAAGLIHVSGITSGVEQNLRKKSTGGGK